MRETIKLVKILSNDPEIFDKSHNFKKESNVQLFETATQKMKSQENKEDTDKSIESLSNRIKFLESNEQALIGMEMTNCILKNGCYVAKNKMGTCPCELYRI